MSSFWPRLRRDFRPGRALVVALAAVAVLGALSLWSNGGQSTNVRLEVRGDQVSTYVDSLLVLTKRFAAPAAGRVYVLVDSTRGLPSLPAPNGLDRAVVRDIDGSVLYSDDFDDAQAQGPWRIVQGTPSFGESVWGAEDGRIAVELPIELSDFILELEFRNVTSVEVVVRATSANSGIVLGLRPYRQLDVSMGLREAGNYRDFETLSPVRLERTQTIRSMLAMTLRPFSLFLQAAGVVVLLLAALLLLPRVTVRIPLFVRHTPLMLALVLAVFGFVTALVLLRGPGQGMPHVPDELAYMFQGEVLATGRFSVPPPAAEEAFRWSNPGPINVHDGRWASMYPPVHPFMLSLGALVDAMWLVPPTLGAGCVMLVFLIGRRLHGAPTGLLSAFLFAVSPFFLMTSATFMSHTTTAFFLLLSLYWLTKTGESPIAYSLATGFGVGLVFASRPLTGLSLSLPYGCFLALGLATASRRSWSLQTLGGAALGGLLALSGYLFYQWMATGDPFLIESTQGGSDAFGFGGRHSLEVGLSNEQAQLSYLLLVLHNWAPSLGIVLVMLPFLLGTTSRWDWLLLAISLFLAGAYTLYFVNGIMHGPRYWYEITPLLMLLSGRGISLAATRLAELAALITQKLGHGRPTAPVPALVLVALPFLYLAGSGSVSWLNSSNDRWFAEFMPSTAKSFRGFNGIDDRLLKHLRNQKWDNALVLVDDCGGWQCYGSTFWLNTPTLDGDVVYARLVTWKPEQIGELFAAYPDRVLFRANYYAGRVEPVTDQMGSQMTSRQAFEAGIFGVQPGPDASERDRVRLAALEAIAAALEEYRETHGAYPQSKFPQTLCSYPGDAGCALKSIVDLPSDPLPGRQFQYWTPTPDVYVLITALEDSPTSCAISLPERSRPSGNYACLVKGDRE